MAKSKSNGPSYEEIEQAFRQKKFSSVYLFHGEEDFLVEQTIDLLVKEAIDESTRSFNLDIVYGGDVDVKDVVALASAYPMMSERRVVIVREFDRLSNKEMLIPFIENPLASTIIAFISEKADFRLKFFQTLKTKATVVEFKQLYDDRIPDWINKRIEKLGKKITIEACQLLQSYIGRSLREAQNEIDKLFIYVGDKKIIDVEDISQVAGTSRQFTIYDLQRAIGEKDISKALKISERMMDAGEYPVGIIVMLTKYFQKLYLLQEINNKNLSEFQLAAELGVSPYFVNEYINAARNYSSAQLERCFAALIETDETLKSSSRDPKLLMTLLLYQIIKGEKQKITS